MKMPFGKYVGKDLEDIPDGYIRWVLENCTLVAHLEQELENQLLLREGKGVNRGRQED